MPFPVIEDAICAAEEKLGRVLPPALRARLQQDNGGEVEAAGDDWQLFPVWDASDRKRMKRTANHIVYETNQFRAIADLGDDVIAIASNGSGDYLIVRGGSDTVELWKHETERLRKVTVNW